MEVKPKERPIIFSSEMVKAILDGRKSVTRRVVKLRDPSQTYSVFGDDGWPESANEAGEWNKDRCPHGQPGDRLWVRESWRRSRGQSAELFYKADYGEYDQTEKGPWLSPLFMSRADSRLALEITAVRVERLQDITFDDCLAEGIVGTDAWRAVQVDEIQITTTDPNKGIDEGWESYTRVAFSKAWDKINGKKHPWSSNPWVWAISFTHVPVSGGGGAGEG
jgi:hypothetical protein